MTKIISEVNRYFIGMIWPKPAVTQMGGEGTYDTLSLPTTTNVEVLLTFCKLPQLIGL